MTNTMRIWEETSEKSFQLIDDVWTVYLKIEEDVCLLEIYLHADLIKTMTWGSAISQQKNVEAWCKIQSVILLEQEIKKRG